MKKNSREIAIKLTNVTKRYTIHHEKPTFSEKLLKRSQKQIFTALNDIDLTIYKGEKVGIIGSNGAGKTTLLKLITGVTAPNVGTVVTQGKIVSLLDLGAGFHPDLTGVENIYLNGLIVGMSQKEIKEKFDNIVQFADIGTFIDAPMYTYSLGMKLRVGFSIGVFADPDILVLDEGISAGDQNFVEKSTQKIEEFFKLKKTIIVVSHWLDYLEARCNRIVWIKKGEIEESGSISVIKKYKKFQMIS
ncbi:MAG: ABC transporter ATP-binding protein [Patescibacteria group bacterium]